MAMAGSQNGCFPLLTPHSTWLNFAPDTICALSFFSLILVLFFLKSFAVVYCIFQFGFLDV